MNSILRLDPTMVMRKTWTFSGGNGGVSYVSPEDSQNIHIFLSADHSVSKLNIQMNVFFTNITWRLLPEGLKKKKKEILTGSMVRGLYVAH